MDTNKPIALLMSEAGMMESLLGCLNAGGNTLLSECRDAVRGQLDIPKKFDMDKALAMAADHTREEKQDFERRKQFWQKRQKL